MDGRAVPDLEDVNAMAVPVLSHRVVVNFQAEAEGMSPEKLVTVPSGRSRLFHDGRGCAPVRSVESEILTQQAEP